MDRQTEETATATSDTLKEVNQEAKKLTRTLQETEATLSKTSNTLRAADSDTARVETNKSDKEKDIVTIRPGPPKESTELSESRSVQTQQGDLSTPTLQAIEKEQQTILNSLHKANREILTLTAEGEFILYESVSQLDDYLPYLGSLASQWIEYSRSIDPSKVKESDTVGRLARGTSGATDLVFGYYYDQQYIDKVDKYTKRSTNELDQMIANAELRIEEFSQVESGGFFDRLFDGSFDTAQREIAGLNESIEQMELARARIIRSRNQAYHALETKIPQAIEAEKIALSNLEAQMTTVPESMKSLQDLMGSGVYQNDSDSLIMLAESYVKLQTGLENSENAAAAHRAEILRLEKIQKELGLQTEETKTHTNDKSRSDKESTDQIKEQEQATTSLNEALDTQVRTANASKIALQESSTVAQEYQSQTQKLEQHLAASSHQAEISRTSVLAHGMAVLTTNETLSEQTTALQENTAATLEQQSQTQKLEQDQAASNQQTEQSTIKIEEQKIAVDDLNGSLDGQVQILNLVQQARQKEAKTTQNTLEKHKKVAKEISKVNQELQQGDLESSEDPISKFQESFTNSMQRIDDTLANAQPKLKGGFDSVGEEIQNAMQQFDEILSDAKPNLKSGFESVVKEFKAAMQQLDKIIANTQPNLKDGFDGVEKEVGNTFDSIAKESKGIFDGVEKEAENIFDGIAKDIEAIFDRPAEEVKDAFDGTAKEVKDTFNEAAKEIEKSFNEVARSVENSFNQVLAETVYDAITRPLLTDIRSVISGITSTGSEGGGLDLAAIASNRIDGIGNWLSSTSISDSMGNWAWSSSISEGIAQNLGYATGGAAGSAQLAGNTAALKSGAWAGQGTINNVGMIGAGVAGHFIGDALFDGKGYSSQGGSFGASAGAKIGASAGLPGMAIGAVVGALFGSIAGSMFGDRDPKLDFRTRAVGDDSYKFDREEKGVFAESAFGQVGFEAKNTRRMKRAFDGFENATEFLQKIALLDNMVASLAESDSELQDMADIVQQIENNTAEDPQGILENLTDRYVAAFSNISSRLTDGVTAEIETKTGIGRHVTDTEDYEYEYQYEELVTNVENELFQAFLELDEGKAIPAITSVISMERIGDAIGGAVTDDIYDSIESAFDEDLDITSVIGQLNIALTALPSLGEFNKNFDILATGALEASGNIVQLAGGLQNLAASQSQYYDLYFTEEEKFKTYAEQMATAMGNLGLELVSSHDGFRELVEGLDLTTEAGQEQYVGLMALAPAMDQYLNEIERETQAKTDAVIASQKSTIAYHKSFSSIVDLLDDATDPLSDTERTLVNANSALTTLGLTGMSYEEAISKLSEYDESQLAGLAEALGLSFADIQTTIQDIINGNNEITGGSSTGSVMSVDTAETLLDAATTVVWQYADIIDESFNGVIPTVEQFNEVFGDMGSSELDALKTKYSGLISQLGGLPDTVAGVNDAYFNQFDSMELVDPAGGVAKQISLAYQEFVGRLPDQNGLDFWLDEIKNGATIDDVRAGIASTLEAKLYEKGGLNLDLIDAYQQVLGRLPDQDGFEYWLGQLDLNPSVQAVIDGISDNAEAASYEQLQSLTDDYKVYFDGLDPEVSGLGNALIGLESTTNQYNQALIDSQSVVGDTADAIQSSNAAESQRQSLISAWFSATKNEDAVRQMQLVSLGASSAALEEHTAALDGLSNVEIQEKIWAYEDAEEASQALEQKFNFNAGIQEQLDKIGLSDKDLALYDLDKQYDQWIKDANELGGNLIKVDELYWARREEIADKYAQQTAEQLVEDAGLNNYLQSVSDYVDDQTQFIKDYTAEQIALVEQWQDVAKGLRDYVDQIRLSELSTDTPAERLAHAEKLYADLLAKAKSGDIEAAQELTGAADAYLNESDSYYGRSVDYTSIFDTVTDQLDQLGIVRTDEEIKADINRIEAEMAAELEVLSTYAESEIEWAKSQAKSLTNIDTALGEWPSKFEDIIEGLQEDIDSAEKTEETEKEEPPKPDRLSVNLTVKDSDTDAEDTTGSQTSSTESDTDTGTNTLAMSVSQAEAIIRDSVTRGVDAAAYQQAASILGITSYEQLADFLRGGTHNEAEVSSEEAEAFNDVADKLDTLDTDLQTAYQDDIENLHKQIADEQRELTRYAEGELEWERQQTLSLFDIEAALNSWPETFSELMSTLGSEISAAIATGQPVRQVPSPTNNGNNSSDNSGNNTDQGMTESQADSIIRDFASGRAVPTDLLPEAAAMLGVTSYDEMLAYVDGSHARGLSRVPFNGYRAKLHKDEMVLTADVSNHIRRSMDAVESAPGQRSHTEMLAELRALRESNQRLETELAALRFERKAADNTSSQQRDQQIYAAKSLIRANRSTVETV